MGGPTVYVFGHGNSRSDSRNIKCATLDTFRDEGNVVDIPMHYTPSELQRAAAATAIDQMLRHLYPARADMP